MRDDLFTVVFEQVMTDSALYADILLPATTFLEHAELSNSYGTYAVMLGAPVVAPAGEARSNEDVFAALADRLGVALGMPRGEALLRRALAAIGGPLGGDGARKEDALTRLRRDKVLRFDFPGERPVQFKTSFPTTTDGTIHLWPGALGDDPYLILPDPGDADPRHPLALISPATNKTISSSLAEYGFDEAVLEMHPDDARPRRLADGAVVRVHNDLGEVVVPLRLNRDVRPGVVFLPKGLWNRHTRNGAVSTAVSPDHVTAVSGGACFNDARVEVHQA
jgi:anaerobic selenocysteine-containing dehydrogenase